MFISDKYALPPISSHTRNNNTIPHTKITLTGLFMIYERSNISIVNSCIALPAHKKKIQSRIPHLFLSSAKESE